MDGRNDNLRNEVDYQSLMSHRIRKILLICNNYDRYTLEEDGHIESQITHEYAELNLSNPPAITHADSTRRALEILADDHDFDLIITMYNVGEIDVFSFSKIVKEQYPSIALVLLTNFSKEIYRRIEEQDTSWFDYIFCWNNSTDLIIAIIKLLEDSMNAEHDISEVGVQAILLVEDSIRYYSTYLPAIYKLVLQQNGESIKEALNEQQRIMRKRARPKILMATNYNDAVALYRKYKGNLLGVISDVGFVVDRNDSAKDEKLDAGIDLCRLIRSDNPMMPFLLQSSQESMRSTAEQLGVGFIVKYSKTLIHDLGDYISREFAFGELVFKDPSSGDVVMRANDLYGLQTLMRNVDDDILLYNISNNYLSKWLLSRGLFRLGKAFRAKSINEFGSADEIKRFCIEQIREYRVAVGQGVIAQFDPATYNDAIWFARIGNGSLGGKARGLAFMNSVLQRHKLYDRWDDVRVMIPRTVVVTTEYFDRFIIDNGLQYVINADITDEEILSEFVASTLPDELIECLRAFVRTSRTPLAVRSSSKLEDSYYQPFAGIYSTYMIPHTENEDQQLRLLGKAIKSVYASVFFSSSRAYITATANVISEEKMAIVIQEICGSEDKGYFFPTLSGVARSLNHYPIGYEKAEEGIVKMAFGLGKSVVDGDEVLRFSPRYPNHVLQTSTSNLAMRDTQHTMYALNLKPEKFKTSIDDGVNLERLDIMACKGFRNMRHVASTWDMHSQRIVDSALADGFKVITFAPILKFNTFPLADIVNALLEVGVGEMKCHVEIEFAANLDTAGRQRIFNVLQIRPIADNETAATTDWSKISYDDAIVYSQSALGTGAIENVSDIVYVRAKAFDPSHTADIARELTSLNARMRSERRGYVLLGPGRWGSSNPWLGIPIKWSDISESKVIIECGLEDFNIEPSQGSHFFQNVTSFGVGYMTVNPYAGDGKFDVERLDRMPAEYESRYLRAVRFDRPLEIFVDGVNNKGIIK